MLLCVWRRLIWIIVVTVTVAIRDETIFSFYPVEELVTLGIGATKLKGCAQHRKKHYDLHTRPQTYDVGSWVWCLDPRRHQGKCQKWQPPYCGSFQIIWQVGPVNYEIKGGPRGKTRIVHVDKLKSCIRSSNIDHLGDSSTTVSHHDDTPLPSRPRRTITRPCRFRD